MNTDQTTHQPPNCNGELTCSGIWGGVTDLDREINAGGLLASLYSSSCDGARGGDIHYFGVCNGEQVMRVAIADVVGHGRAVSDVSEHVYQSMKANMCNTDTGAILAELNRFAARDGLKAMTTAAVLGYHALRREFRFSYAGHPPMLYKPVSQKGWSPVIAGGDADGGGTTGLPLAVDPTARFTQRAFRAAAGDRLFIYTDGVTEAPNAAGKLFGTRRLKEILDANGQAPLPQLKAAVLAALHRHTRNGLTHDDVTLIALEVR